MFLVSAGSSGDFYVFDPDEMAWTNLSNARFGPSPRHSHGFVFASGKLYVQGGRDESGVKIVVCFVGLKAAWKVCLGQHVWLQLTLRILLRILV